MVRGTVGSSVPSQQESPWSNPGGREGGREGKGGEGGGSFCVELVCLPLFPWVLRFSSHTKENGLKLLPVPLNSASGSSPAVELIPGVLHCGCPLLLVLLLMGLNEY